MLEKEDIIQKDILALLKETLAAFKNEEYNLLRDISNKTTHNASIFQDQDSVSIAVIVYALFKIAIRRTEGDAAITTTLKQINNHLQKAYQSLEKKDVQEYRQWITHIISDIAKADDKLRIYIQETIKQAEIKKGSRLYEHGLSTAQAAEVLGISQWELMPYVGKTTFAELRDKPARIMRRMQIARTIFGLAKKEE